MKIRVYELAKELNISSKELLEYMSKIKVEVASHMSTLEDEQVHQIRKGFSAVRSESVKHPDKMTISSNEKRDKTINVESSQMKQTESKQPASHDSTVKKPATLNDKNMTSHLIISENLHHANKNQHQKNNNQKGHITNRPKHEEHKNPNTKNVDRERENNKNVKGQVSATSSQQNVTSSGNKPFSPSGKNMKNDFKKPEYKKQEQTNVKKDRKDIETPESFPKNDNKNKFGKGKKNTKNQTANAQEKGNPFSKKDKKNKGKQNPQEQTGSRKEGTKPADEIKIIEMEDTIVVRDFAEKLGVSPSKIIQKLIALGIMINQNQPIDFDTASLIGEEFNAIIESKKPVEEISISVEEEFRLDFEDNEDDLKPRAPIVTVMGHVDHGKTSLLDAIKKTHVTTTEAGGITQHIGAYSVSWDDKRICFLDTPGHEAFTAMRARGAQVTDIAILVVAADDGVMPQTVEAINHAKAANVPVIVVINKIDKEGANIDRIKQELVDNGLVPEDWGGDVITVPVSAKKMIGIGDLLEMVILVAEMQDLKANPNRTMAGTVVEAELDKHKGPMATVLISKGTLKVGDMVVSGAAYGKIRAMFDDKNRNIKKAGPSTPVVILGLSEVPNAGDLIFSTSDDRTAKAAAERHKTINREELMKSDRKVSLDDLFERIKLGEIKDLNIIIKADVKGSIEALKQSLLKLGTDEVQTKVIHEGVGGITESDIMLASASNAIVIGFNVRPNSNALTVAKTENVDIRTYRVIYEAIEDIKAAIIGMHAPKFVEEIIGQANIREVFGLPNGNKVAGIYVTSGMFTRKAKVRLIRDDIVVYEGNIASLRRFKDDVKELQNGYEGGLMIENYNDIKTGDELEAFVDKEVELKDLKIEG